MKLNTTFLSDELYALALEATKATIEVELPWVKLPIFNKIFNLLLNTVGNYLFRNLCDYATLTEIDIKTSQEETAYKKALEALRQAQAKGDTDALSKAKQDFKNTLAWLIHDDS